MKRPVLLLLLMTLFLAGCASHECCEVPHAAPASTPVSVAAVSPAPSALPDGGRSLFDGKSLEGWKVLDYAGGGEVKVADQRLVIGGGETLSGVRFTNALPKSNYEVSLEAMRVEGADFFCGLTFPVGNSACTLILGGWGGALVGISSVNGDDASENETTQYMKFEKGRWYRVRVRVTPAAIEAWVDDDKRVNLSTAGKTISMRPGDIEQCVPFGLATYQTTAAIRNLRMRPLGN